MSHYLLAVMKGQNKSLWARLIMLILFPFSLLYAVGVLCHRRLMLMKGVYKAPKRVVSVGNITVGGVGKTPLVIWLARRLQDKGLKCVVLTRGYMPKLSSSSDEVDMLGEQMPYIPILAGADRIANIKKSCDTMPVDVYIADDAFQHWPLGRDLNIVAIDASNPFGNGCLLPAGILREPLSALKRADILVLTKIEGVKDIQTLRARLVRINPKALMVESRYTSGRVVDVFDNTTIGDGFLNDLKVIAFCAIGDHLSFESSLRAASARVIKLFSFRDHYSYQPEDIKRMVDYCREQGLEVLVTTHKDAVKLRVFKDLFAGLQLVYMPIQLEITKGSDEFVQKVINLCRD